MSRLQEPGWGSELMGGGKLMVRYGENGPGYSMLGTCMIIMNWYLHSNVEQYNALLYVLGATFDSACRAVPCVIHSASCYTSQAVKGP